ncbi:MAG TPA: AMP-dependent synthetase [Desulfobacteraceae bacterium]|nr:AMP-binding protein [Deltaproteobacteria bacterium]HDI59495.1 AMP-dependent synthetase [Desulfobacteraceae bacterium]
MNLGMLFARHARYRPNHTAVVFGDQRLTYLQFNQQINKLANAMVHLGIGKGSKVATVLPNCVELLEAYWAAAKVGAVVVPMSTLLMEGALRSLLKDADAQMIITNSAFAPVIGKIQPDLPDLRPGCCLLTDAVGVEGFQGYQELKNAAADSEPEVAEVRGDDPFNIMYSSGTTGLPKGIVHTHDIRIAYGTSFAAAFRLAPESITLHAGAIVFNGAFVDLMPTVFQGATYVLMPQFNPVDYIECIYREKVTHVMMVPAQIIAMLNAPNFDADKLASLEMILALGAPLHLEHKETLNRLLPGRFYELYGLTEGFVTVLDKLDYPRKPASVGIPLPLFEMKILDKNGAELPPGEVGEICGKGPILMPGYYKRPDLTEKAIVDGWLHSGDLGYVDEDGFLYLVDRIKDMIISGGVNVYPKDIEEIIVQHPDVCEVAVFGVPDPRWGEVPYAAVTMVPSAAVSEEALKEWINARVGAKFQRVAAVKIIKDFPRNVAGKTLKRELRQMFGQPPGGDGSGRP